MGINGKLRQPILAVCPPKYRFYYSFAYEWQVPGGVDRPWRCGAVALLPAIRLSSSLCRWMRLPRRDKLEVVVRERDRLDDVLVGAVVPVAGDELDWPGVR